MLRMDNEQTKTDDILKILRLFQDPEVDRLKLNYEFVNATKFPFSFANMLAYKPEKSDPEDMIRLLEETEKFVQEQDIDGVLLKFDIEALILSAVFSKYPKKNIKIPSFESIFLSHHKYYGRLKERNPIKFGYIDIFEDDYKDKILPFPFFLKPIDLNVSLHQYIIKNEEDFENVLKILRKELPEIDKYSRFCYERYLDFTKYPLAAKYIVLLEEIVDDGYQINWEGFADDDGNIFTYCWTDEVLADKNKVIFSDFIMPSGFNEDLLEKAEKVCCDYLRDINFRNGFANIELWVRKNNNIQIIEVNPRCAYPYYHQYLLSFGTNLYDSVIQLSLGIIPDQKSIPSKSNFKRFSTTTVISTKMNGKLSEIVNYPVLGELMKKNNDYIFYIMLSDPNFIIENNIQNAGRVIMRIFYGKESYEEIIKESLSLKKALLLKDDYFL